LKLHLDVCPASICKATAFGCPSTLSAVADGGLHVCLLVTSIGVSPNGDFAAWNNAVAAQLAGGLGRPAAPVSVYLQEPSKN
jgi:hypothetical protein